MATETQTALGDCPTHGEVEGTRQGFVALVAEVDVVARVEFGAEFGGVLRIAHGGIEIHDGVEVPLGANPAIDGLADFFGLFVGDPHAFFGHDGGSHDFEAGHVRAFIKSYVAELDLRYGPPRA